MSTVMYVYRVNDADLWSAIDQIKTWYQANHLVFTAVKSIAVENANAERVRTVWALIKDPEWHVHLQLFRETNSTWLFRVLENSFMFLNGWEKISAPIMAVFYDDRSDMPEAWAANEAVADWCDAQIQAEHYLTAALVDQTILAHYHTTCFMQSIEHAS